WLWNLQSNRKDDVRKLGSHSNPKQLTANRVRLVAFLDEKRVVSVARDATVMRWDLRPGGKPGLLFRFDLPAVLQAAFSPERWLFAAAGEAPQGEKQPVALVALRAINEKAQPPLKLAPGHFPHSLAFDRKGERLAVGVRVVPQKTS